MFLEYDETKKFWKLWDKEPKYVEGLYGPKNGAELMYIRNVYKDIKNMMDVCRVIARRMNDEH